MTRLPEGNAIVYCQQAFGTTNGKTAHGLVRRTLRYNVLSVIDSQFAGRDAGEVLHGVPVGIPIYGSVPEAVDAGGDGQHDLGGPTHLVVGLAPDGGRLPANARREIKTALERGLNIDSGLHDFLSEDPELAALAAANGVVIRDIRKPPARNDLHFFTGKIKQVGSLKVAMLGTDSAVGKRTTAWLLIDALQEAGFTSELVGTGQTAWMQGAKHSIVLDSLVNDFVAGEIEHAVWSAWTESRPDVIVIEGQGSLMNPAYPGGHEILAAGRPDCVVLQHAPARDEYDGFPGYPLHDVTTQIKAIELLSGKPVVAVTVSHEGLGENDIEAAVATVLHETALPTCAPLRGGVRSVVAALEPYLRSNPLRDEGEPVDA